MKTAHANRKERVALQRFAAISFLQQELREGQTLTDALRRAVLRPWPDENGDYYSSRTLETYWYAFHAGGFAALAPKDREDRGTCRKLPAALGEWVIEQIKAHPAIALKVLYPRWLAAGQLLPSLSTLYRFLRQRGYDARSLRRGRLESGPTKAFEVPFVNDLWMVDFSPGPRLSIDGKSHSTHLCVLLDDHSRLITYPAYYPGADTYALLDALKAAIQRRGLPEKLYTDRGGPFINHHTAIVCANLGIRLLHAKPYAAWSKGKVERCIHTIQQGFEATLQLPESRAQNLEDLNQKLSRWIQSVYHLRPHSSTGQTPHERFAAAAARLRQIALGLDLDALFYTRETRTVRKDGTVRLHSRFYEVDLSLRGLEVELRFDPFTRQRLEVYHQGRAHGLARQVDLHLNSRLNGGTHYERR